MLLVVKIERFDMVKLIIEKIFIIIHSLEGLLFHTTVGE